MDISGNLCQVTLKRCVADIFLWLCDVICYSYNTVNNKKFRFTIPTNISSARSPQRSSTTLLSYQTIFGNIWRIMDSGRNCFSITSTTNNRNMFYLNDFRECIVLKRSADGSVTIVIQNYEYEDDEFQTFTVMKLATNDMNRIEWDLLIKNYFIF